MQSSYQLEFEFDPARFMSRNELENSSIAEPSQRLLAYEDSRPALSRISMKAIRILWKNTGLARAHELAISPCIMKPTCSHYAYMAIGEYGILEGSSYAMARLNRCNQSDARMFPVVDDRYYDPLP